MLLKLGVDISRLARPLRRRFDVIDEVFKSVSGREAIITSTYEGDHRPNSLHYANAAVDFRLPGPKVSDVIIRLRQRLGKDFDVVGEASHIHVEYDPKEEVKK